MSSCVSQPWKDATHTAFRVPWPKGSTWWSKHRQWPYQAPKSIKHLSPITTIPVTQSQSPSTCYGWRERMLWRANVYVTLCRWTSGVFSKSDTPTFWFPTRLLWSWGVLLADGGIGFWANLGDAPGEWGSALLGNTLGPSTLHFYSLCPLSSQSLNLTPNGKEISQCINISPSVYLNHHLS